MIGTRVYEREFNAAGYVLAALCAPALSVVIVLLGALAASVIDGSFATVDGGASAIGMGLFLIVICAVWGLVPALLFGAIVLVPFERFRRGRNPPQWAYPLSGLGAATLYVIVSLAFAKSVGEGVGVFAPWAVLAGTNAPIRGVGLLGGAIILAGGAAGLIYERFSRVAYRPARWRPSDGPRD